MAETTHAVRLGCLVLALNLLSDGVGPAQAEEIPRVNWRAALEGATACVAESEPDLKRAISCYDGAISTCIAGPSDRYETCLEASVAELWGLFDTYNLRNLDAALAAQNAPERCQEIVKEAKPSGMSAQEFLLQCEFTALTRQVITAHVVSVWDERP